MKKSLTPFVLVLLTGTLLTACVSVPKATVDLSSELSTMITSSRQSYLNLLDEYIATRKSMVNQFINDKWTPMFINNFVEGSHVLDSINAASTNTQKGELMILFAQAALPKINAKRDTLMAAIDKIDNMVRSGIETHYSQMMAVNQSLTAYLSSAANVEQTRDQLLSQLGINNPQNLIPIDQINSALTKILSVTSNSSDVEAEINKIRQYLSGSSSNNNQSN